MTNDDDEAVRPSLVPAGEDGRLLAGGPRARSWAGRVRDLTILGSGLLLAVAWVLPAFDPSPSGIEGGPSFLAISLFGLVAALSAASRLAGHLARRHDLSVAAVLLWLAVAMVTGWHLRERWLAPGPYPTRVVDGRLWPLVVVGVVLTYLGTLSFLPRFERARREGRLIWTGSALSGLLFLSRLVNSGDGADSGSLPALFAAAVALPALVLAFWASRAGRRRAAAPKPRAGVGRLLWMPLVLVASIAPVPVTVDLSEHLLSWIAGGAAAALFLGGAFAEAEVLEHPPVRRKRKPLVSVREPDDSGRRDAQVT